MQLLKDKHCSPASQQSPLTGEILHSYHNQVPMWQLIDNKSLHRHFEFKNFKQTMFFINAMAYIVEQEIHHPDVKFGYNYCDITFTTHDIGNCISENDFICAAKINQLIKI